MLLCLEGSPRTSPQPLVHTALRYDLAEAKPVPTLFCADSPAVFSAVQSGGIQCSLEQSGVIDVGVQLRKSVCCAHSPPYSPTHLTTEVSVTCRSPIRSRQTWPLLPWRRCCHRLWRTRRPWRQKSSTRRRGAARRSSWKVGVCRRVSILKAGQCVCRVIFPAWLSVVFGAAVTAAKRCFHHLRSVRTFAYSRMFSLSHLMVVVR